MTQRQSAEQDTHAIVEAFPGFDAQSRAVKTRLAGASPSLLTKATQVIPASPARNASAT